MKLVIGLLAITASGCGANDDGLHCPSNSVLFGQWASDGDLITFGTDCSFEFLEESVGEGPSGDHLIGTFATDGHRLEANMTDQAGENGVWKMTFYVTDDDYLVLGAGYPLGNQKTLVGSWQWENYIANETDYYGGITTMTLKDNGTGTLEPSYENGKVKTGTWGPHDESGYKFTFVEQGININLRFDYLDNAIIGDKDWQRLN